LQLESSSSRVRCVSILQSQVYCCNSRYVKLEVWDGSEWQVMHVWDTQGLERLSRGFFLRVPITCDRGFPEGTGVVHDCRGRPVVGLQDGDSCTAGCGPSYVGEGSTFTCSASGEMVGLMPSCHLVDHVYSMGIILTTFVTLTCLACMYRCWFMHQKVQLTDDPDMIISSMQGRWFEQDGDTMWQTILAIYKEDDMAALAEASSRMDEEPEEKNSGDSDVGTMARGVKSRIVRGKQTVMLKGNLKADVKEARQGKVRGDDTAIVLEWEQELKEEVKEKRITKKINRVFLDGLCSPCEDPDLCLTCMVCPCCRVADTWHTLGVPASFTYWRTFWLYAMCPCIWPCLNFWGRNRIRKLFSLPKEPHRDFMVHLCCCCFCAPCAIMQEARTVDAPLQYHAAMRRIEESKKHLAV